mgnify:CR=1 FL=1
MKASNYDITLARMPAEFLKYDQKRMIRMFCPDYDTDFLHLRLLDRRYRVSREEGTIEWQEEDESWSKAGFLDAMTIYDLLCCARDDCALAGRYCRAENLPGAMHGANPDKDAFSSFAKSCDQAPEKLAAACRALGGTDLHTGEISYQLPLFPFLPVIVQFWASDEEFPPVFKLMWDENVLAFLKFETVCYAARFLTARLQAHMGLPETTI